MLQIFTTEQRLNRGLSYWKVKLNTGKTFHEGQMAFDFLHGAHNMSWYEDIVGSGDNKYISEITLCTPQGDVTIPILEPYTAFQFQRGTISLFYGEKIANCQIIGRIDDKETGMCTAAIWDVQGDETGKHLYIDYTTSIFNFKKWREGVADAGPMNYDVIGLRGLGGAS